MSVASSAAKEIFQKVDSFLKAFETTSGYSRETKTVTSLSDPRVTQLYYRALNTLLGDRAATLDDLAERFADYIEAAETISTKSNPKTLSKLMEFCLAVHRELLADTYRAYSERSHARRDP